MAETAGVEFFCYHRDRAGSMALREELLEEHWSYMDRYQAEMIARGPTLAAPPGRDELIAYGLTAGRYAVIEVHRWQFGGRA